MNDGLTSLREAVDLANATPTTGQHLITFDTARVTSPITLTDNPLLIGTNINISWTGAGNLTIQRTGGAGLRLFMVGPASISTLGRLTFTGGGADGGNGGAVYSQGALTLSECVFWGNSAGAGGAVYSTGFLTVVDSTFYCNVAAESGGAISAVNCVLSVTGGSVLDNQAGQLGGGIHVDRTTATLSGVEVARNHAVGTARFGAMGGGIYAAYADLTLTGGTVLKENRANPQVVDQGTGGRGGGVYALDGTLRLPSVTFDTNAAATGTGVYRTNGVTQVGTGTFINNDNVVGL